MKKIRIDAIAFIVILGGLLVANFLNFEKDTVSALENRMLKSKPEFTIESLFNGSYFRDYEDFYSDTFIKRDNMVMASRDIRNALSLDEPGVTLVITHESGENINTGEQTPDPTPTPSAEPIPAQTENPATETPAQ
ncbi:MAG TPA: DHHW family protein, partial [Clostridia bacterium]|nr:DHHW family protein [Clostridia bacterium]